MLSDPTVVTHGMTLTPSGGIATNFRRTKMGSYAAIDGPFSTDQMCRLTIQPNLRPTGPSIYKTSIEIDKNVAPVNGVQQSDDTLRVSLQFSGNLRSFGASDFVSAIWTLTWTIVSNMPRILSGES